MFSLSKISLSAIFLTASVWAQTVPKVSETFGSAYTILKSISDWHPLGVKAISTQSFTMAAHGDKFAAIDPIGSGDLGTVINNTMNALPASGGAIHIPAQPNGQCYQFITPIKVTKPVIILGDGPATCLAFRGSGVAILFAEAPGGSLVPNHASADGSGLRDLTLLGAGPDQGQTGLALGGADTEVGFYGSNINVDNFGLGLQFNRGVWNFKIDHSVFGLNGKNVDWPASLSFGGENMEFDHTTFVGATFANSLEFNSGSGGPSNLSSLTFISCNFDDAQLVINNGSGSVRMYSPHFENPNRNSGDQPFLRISAFTAATDVQLDGPDFYNDSSSPYPGSFIEINGGPTVYITQMRSLNLDGTDNVPTNIALNGDVQLTLTASSPLRGAKKQYVVNSGNPRLWETGNQTDSNSISSPSPLIYTQNFNTYGPNVQSPSVILGGSGSAPMVGFSLWSGVGATYYGAQIRENVPGELDFCFNGVDTVTGGTYTCNAAIKGGVFTSLVPDGTAPISVESRTPPDNLNAWPATYTASGQQIPSPHIVADKVILPAGGQAYVSFESKSQFTQTPACTLSYQTPFLIPKAVDLSSSPSPKGIAIYGREYYGVYFVCIGN